jgi:hypothetical protein
MTVDLAHRGWRAAIAIGTTSMHTNRNPMAAPAPGPAPGQNPSRAATLISRTNSVPRTSVTRRRIVSGGGSGWIFVSFIGW